MQTDLKQWHWKSIALTIADRDDLRTCYVQWPDSRNSTLQEDRC